MRGHLIPGYVRMGFPSYPSSGIRPTQQVPSKHTKLKNPTEGIRQTKKHPKQRDARTTGKLPDVLADKGILLPPISDLRNTYAGETYDYDPSPTIWDLDSPWLLAGETKGESPPGVTPIDFNR